MTSRRNINLYSSFTHYIHFIRVYLCKLNLGICFCALKNKDAYFVVLLECYKYT